MKDKIDNIMELFKSGKATQEQWYEMALCVYIISDTPGKWRTTEK